MTFFSLAHLTALSLPPPDLIRAAADAGYQSVGLRLLQVAPGTPFYPLMSDPPLLRESRSARIPIRPGRYRDHRPRYRVRPEYFPWTDTLHFDRCGNVPTDLDAIPIARLPFIHVCDAPAERPTTQEGWLHHARAERLPPGEGGIAIKTVVDHMPPGIPIALEVPMNALTKAAGPEAVIRRVIDAARTILDARRASTACTADRRRGASPSTAD